MHTPLKALLAALLITSAGHALAASSVDLSVRGLITPSACEPALSNGGLYDIGKISAKDLQADQPTTLPSHLLQVNLTCDAATLMALEAKDNRAGSDFNNDPKEFGLGLTSNNEKIGSITLSLSSPVADGVAARTIGSMDGGNTWVIEQNLMRDNLISVADDTTVTPLPVQSMTADLSIGPKIAPANGLTLTNEVAIDGSVTLTVKYL